MQLSVDSQAIYDMIVPLMAAIIGALIGATFSGRQMFNIERFRLFAEMHREISGPFMMDVRVDAQNLLAAYRGYDLRELYDSHTLIEDLKKVWVLVGFYERLYIAMHNRSLNRRTATENFCELFLYFYDGYFRPQLEPADWGDYSMRMRDLHDLFKKNAKRKDWEKWKKQAKDDIKAKFQNTPKKSLCHKAATRV